MKKYFCEAIGTAVLVLFGCGTAVITGNTVAIALAFGLSIVAMANVIGDISGCHVNPAVSLAMLINKKITVKEFGFYVLAQVLGAFIGAGLLFIVLTQSTAVVELGKGIVEQKISGGEISSQITEFSDFDLAIEGVKNENSGTGIGANRFGEKSSLVINMWTAILVEVILSFVFIYTVIGVTSDEKKANIAGIVIGLTLAFVHILGIALTGTSVNPARSLAPATILAIAGNAAALKQVWVFIVAPFIGSALAAFAFKFLNKEKEAK